MKSNGRTVRAAEMVAPITIEPVTYQVGGVRCAADVYLPAEIAEGRRIPGVVMGHSVIMVKEALQPRRSTWRAQVSGYWRSTTGRSG